MENLTDCEDVVAEVHHGMRQGLRMLSGKWKLEILWLLGQRTYRFNELVRAIPGISQNMLTNQLRELERDGLITRSIFAEVPLRVEYTVTDATIGLRPTMLCLKQWWIDFGHASGEHD